MRVYWKNQCIETLSVLEEAHSEIAECIEKNNIQEAADLLTQCQQGAINVGNLIEESEGEECQEIRQLELYCELSYQVYEDLLNGSSINSRKIVKNLNKPLLRVIEGLQNNIRSTKEIVFLPYKASMWDSLESVWREMSASSDCKAIVVPIPYFDRNPDGSFREMHYEIGQYPPDVPVVSYKDYNIQQRHPEAIYIHNPYDESNYVTSVHPDFYSSKLKDYTDELVYIPYFVLDEVDSSNTAAMKGIEHFITVPAVFHADKVIVQSEEMRKVYVEVLTQRSGEDTRSYWENKIEGTGSPKIYRVSNLKDTDYVLPKEWQKIVNRADGSRKKVILYNTGISAMLQSNDEMLDKIERNFEVFKEHLDDIALLWRPHPLIEATLTSMRMELWERYQEIVRKYREEGWGIYDDSAELDRAIAISDAYYGDASSVVQLYKKTGKPIMIQNVYV